MVSDSPRHAIDPGREVVRIVRGQAGVGQDLAVARIHDQGGAVEAGVAEPVFGRLLQVVVHRQLDAAAFGRRDLFERTDLPAGAVDDHALGAVFTHEQPVVGLLDALLADDVALYDTISDLRVTRFAHVPEQMRGQGIGILARRHLFDADIRQLEIETARAERRDLRQ